MATTKKARKRPGGGAKPARKKRSAQEGDPSEEATASKRDLVVRLLAQIEEKLKEEGVKPTVADFIRLLQLERELSADEAKEVVVRWVEPDVEPGNEE